MPIFRGLRSADGLLAAAVGKGWIREKAGTPDPEFR